MRHLIPLSLLVLSCSLPAIAAEPTTHQWFNTATYNTLENTANESDSVALSSHYYFAPQQHSGVWDDFGYLDTDTNIKLDYFNDDDVNNVGLFAEGFYNNWFASIELADLGETDNHSLSLGYVFAQSLKVSVRLDEFQSDDTVYWFTAQYNHQINENDYLGFTIEADSDVDAWSTSTRYFHHLSNERYVSVDLAYENSGTDSLLSGMANYYFNRNVAIGAGVNDSHLQLEAKYFINSQYYFKAQFSDTEEGEEYTAEFVAQF
jgi:hypothetical protein